MAAQQGCGWAVRANAKTERSYKPHNKTMYSIFAHILHSARREQHGRVDFPMVHVGVVRWPLLDGRLPYLQLGPVPLHEVRVRVRVELLLLVPDLSFGLWVGWGLTLHDDKDAVF